jgi:hypothetical protein
VRPVTSHVFKKIVKQGCSHWARLMKTRPIFRQYLSEELEVFAEGYRCSVRNLNP